VRFVSASMSIASPAPKKSFRRSGLRTIRRFPRSVSFACVARRTTSSAIRDQFRPLRSPAPVAAWYNAFDTRDVVALYPLDASNFPVHPPIENNAKVKNSTDNRHGIAGYLDDAEVAKRVLGPFSSCHAWRGAPGKPFGYTRRRNTSPL